MKNADMPAMPVIDSDGEPRTGRSFEKDYIEQFQPLLGLTKREMMAMHMMAALIQAPDGRVDVGDGTGLPAIAISAADFLLDELERTKGESK